MKILFAVVAWLFVGAIVYQVFLAGVGLFVPGVDSFSSHRGFGWMLHGGPLLVLLAAWGAGAGRTTMWLSTALLLLVGIQPFLPSMRADLPFAAALHPVNALAIFWVAVVVARRALVLARQPAPEAAGPTQSVGEAQRP